MIDQEQYDVAIIGGGLAGLSLSIQLAKKGHKIILFEKEIFPFNKVCGEYISMESWNFLISLGVPLAELQLPLINNLFLTAPDGTALKAKLSPGGFGISRYLLDATLADLAKENGVLLLQQTKVEQVDFNQEFLLHYKSANDFKLKTIKAKLCCAAYGKRSNLDVKWNRGFLNSGNVRLDNYVGIKYHVQINGNENEIALHNFKNGYCGISKIEDEKYCLCYMTKAQNLKKHKGDVAEMECSLLATNPHLKNIFASAYVLDSFPITISQINFNKKAAVENNILMLGDAAGTIPPLCGNGMSMALHSSKLAGLLIHDFLNGIINRQNMEQLYKKRWEKEFGARLRFGRFLQSFFGKSLPTNLFVRLFKLFPFLARIVIKKTHGAPF